MVVIAISILIALAFAYWFAEESGFGDFADWMFGLAIGVMVGGLALLLLSLVANAIFQPGTIYRNKDLVAIQDSSAASGSFFLGSGTVDGEPTYSYYVKDGAARLLGSTAADGVKVFEDSDSAWLKEAFKCEQWFNRIAPCMLLEDVVEIHVPRGTIKQNFVLDAQ